MKWYRKAADEACSDAMFQLAWEYDKGVGVKEDSVEAQRWYREAAQAGDSRAAGMLVAKRIGPAFTTYAAAGASAPSKKAALATVKDAMTELKMLELTVLDAVLNDNAIVLAQDALRERDPADAMLALYQEMLLQYIELFKKASPENRSELAVSFASRSQVLTTAWFHDGRYEDIVAFWRGCYAGLPIAKCTAGDTEPLIRQMNCCVNSLLKSGNREEGRQLLAESLALCDAILAEKPWNWYAKQAYVDLCFDSAASLSAREDRAAAQPLLRRAWIVMLKQAGKSESEWLQSYAGKDLPLKGAEGSFTLQNMKRFFVPADFNGTKVRVHVYVFEGKNALAEAQRSVSLDARYPRRHRASRRGGFVREAAQDSDGAESQLSGPVRFCLWRRGKEACNREDVEMIDTLRFLEAISRPATAQPAERSTVEPAVEAPSWSTIQAIGPLGLSTARKPASMYSTPGHRQMFLTSFSQVVSQARDRCRRWQIRFPAFPSPLAPCARAREHLPSRDLLDHLV